MKVRHWEPETLQWGFIGKMVVALIITFRMKHLLVFFFFPFLIYEHQRDDRLKVLFCHFYSLYNKKVRSVTSLLLRHPQRPLSSISWGFHHHLTNRNPQKYLPLPISDNLHGCLKRINCWVQTQFLPGKLVSCFSRYYMQHLTTLGCLHFWIIKIPNEVKFWAVGLYGRISTLNSTWRIFFPLCCTCMAHSH